MTRYKVENRGGSYFDVKLTVDISTETVSGPDCKLGADQLLTRLDDGQTEKIVNFQFLWEGNDISEPCQSNIAVDVSSDTGELTKNLYLTAPDAPSGDMTLNIGLVSNNGVECWRYDAGTDQNVDTAIFADENNSKYYYYSKK